MPLGEAFSGTCRAKPEEFHVPPEAHLRDVCNCGYARGLCDRFPGGDAADAVRFSAVRENGAVSLIYVFEKDHAPASHGTLNYSVEHDSFSDPAADPFLLRQARAFVASYLKNPAR